MVDLINRELIEIFSPTQITKHPKCLGSYDEWQGEWDCGYQTTIACEECKYGLGRKDPEARCNQ